MSNVAFTTLVILFLALPGYIFRSCYNSGEFTRQLLPRSWSDDVAKAVLYSFPVHFFGLCSFELLQHHHWITHTLSFKVPFHILTGEYAQATERSAYTIDVIVDKLYANSRYLLVYYTLVLGSAFLAGHWLRKLVWELELDVRWPALFRFKSDWLYQMMGRGQLYKPSDNKWFRILGKSGIGSVRHKDTVVILDALTDQETEVAGKLQIYSGIVTGFTVDDKGSLAAIALSKARRGKFVQDGENKRFILEDIPGRTFILPYENIKNLNLAYLHAPARPEKPASPLVQKTFEPHAPSETKLPTADPAPSDQPTH